MDAVAAADEGGEIPWPEIVLFHVVLDRLDRVGRVDRPPAVLIGLQERCENAEPIGGSGADSRVPIHQAINFGQNFLVLGIGCDGLDPHGSMVSGSMRSYCLCVPTNLVRTIWCG